MLRYIPNENYIKDFRIYKSIKYLEILTNNPNQKEASYEFFRCKIGYFLALADGATQRASVLVKLGKGGLGDVDQKKG